jgi:hypothetical protein
LSTSSPAFVVLSHGWTVPIAAVRLLLELEDRGLDVRRDGDGLAIGPRDRLTKEDRDAIKRHRDALRLLVTEGGLVSVDVAGTGAMLIRRRVFERVPGPRWFEHNAEGKGEDYTFCVKARAEGCNVFCDFDTRVGHLTHAIVWPSRNTADGTWGAAITHFSPHGGQAHVVGVIAKAHADTEPTGVAHGEGI